MLKIWGRNNSSNVMKVLWCCAEMNEPFERIDWGGQFGGGTDPAYLAKNPNGRVPTVEDNGNIIWESNTILRYLCTTRGNEKLYPKDPGKRTDVERWMDWQLASSGGAMTTLFFGLVRTAPEKRDAKAIEVARKEAGELWGIVESHLAQHRTPYLGGADFTLADIPVGIHARRWFAFPIERPNHPHLKAWHDRIAERPGYKQHIAIPLT
jgi:glutathione S-transferase